MSLNGSISRNGENQPWTGKK